MRKIPGILFLLSVLATGWASAQCSALFTSPDPMCIRTLPDGTIEVDYDISTMSGASPTDIAEIRLERSNTGIVWTPVANVIIGAVWPSPQMLTDLTANGRVNEYMFRFVAVCAGAPTVDLAPGAIIKNIFLQHTVSNDFTVLLNWNWDSLSTVLTTTINRKWPYTAAGWTAIGNPPYTPSRMTFADTVKTCDDTLAYRIILNNNIKVCQNISNEDTFRVQDVTPPNVPAIDTVSFDEGTNRPLITWNVNPKTDTKGYVVLFYPGNDCGTGRLVDTVFGRLNNKLIDMTWYDGQTSGQYAVYAFDDCAPGPFSISQRSDCANSIQLQSEVDVCEKWVTLTWTPYTDFISGTDVLYKIFLSISGSAFLEIGTTSANEFIHEDPIENQSLRYKVVAFENGGAGPKTASSNRLDVSSDFLKYPEFQYLRFATVHDENYVRLELFTDTKHDVAKYVLKRAYDSSDVFGSVNIVYAPDPKIPIDSITLLSDRSPITDQHQYYYEVDMFDSCGSYMATSNYASTILLRVEVDNVKRVNRLEWTNVFGWAGGTFSYKIHRFLDGKLIKEPITKFADSSATMVHYDSLLLINDNITLGNPSEGNYCYYIVAIENEPTFNGLKPSESRSNEVCVVQQPYITSPNAFTPNGDGRNETFKPVVIYHDISSYEFYIMNRYGEIIYETANVKSSWDGTANGKEVPEGVYVYSVKYRSSTGQSFEDKGTISVVR